MNALAKFVRADCARVLTGQAKHLAALQGGVLLITGGTGFMGTWLAEMVAYLNDHHQFGIRLHLLSSRASLFHERAPHLAARPDIQLIERNILNLVELPDDTSWIIHTAGDPDNRNHATDPLRTLRVIVNGTDALLDSATRLGKLQKILHVSSGLVYGSQPMDLPNIPESFVGSLDCTVPSQVYAEAKRAAEIVCAAYRTQARLPIVTVRPFAFAGPHQRLDGPWAANSFIRDSLRGGPIRIQGDGESVRSYMYPADMALWMLTMLARATPGSVYNLGNPVGITLLELARKITKGFPKPIPIIPRMLGLNAPRATRLVPDVTQAQEALGLTIHTDIDSTIRLAIQWYQALQPTGTP